MKLRPSASFFWYGVTEFIAVLFCLFVCLDLAICVSGRAPSLSHRATPNLTVVSSCGSPCSWFAHFMSGPSLLTAVTVATIISAGMLSYWLLPPLLLAFRLTGRLVWARKPIGSSTEGHPRQCLRCAALCCVGLPALPPSLCHPGSVAAQH